MKVVIRKKVHQSIASFYAAALQLHDALDEQVVMNKKRRLYAALIDLGNYADIYPKARLKEEWIRNGYREFICEDFHFAYLIQTTQSGEQIVTIEDAVHSLLYHN